MQEADAAVSILGEMDAWIICPFFLQGGRYTIDDVHYVADSDRYIFVNKECVCLYFLIRERFPSEHEIRYSSS